MANIDTLIKNIINRCNDNNITNPLKISDKYTKHIKKFKKIHIRTLKNKLRKIKKNKINNIKNIKLKKNTKDKKIKNIRKKYNKKIKKPNNGDTNTANKMGTPFEEFIKDLYANTLNAPTESARSKEINHVFAYTGNNSNPPDAVLRGKDGDAIEFKKQEKNENIQLNSSYFHHKLFSTDSRLKNDCKKRVIKDLHLQGTSSKWSKDILYVIGRINKGILSSLIMFYGRDYASLNRYYISEENNISNMIMPHLWKDTLKDILHLINKNRKDKLTLNNLMTGLSKTPLGYINPETNEIGRVNNVDKLGTYLRVRGMWVLPDPITLINSLIKGPKNKKDKTILNKIKSNDKKVNFLLSNKFSLILIIDKGKVNDINKSNNINIINDLKGIQNNIRNKKIIGKLYIIPISLENPNRSRKNNKNGYAIIYRL